MDIINMISNATGVKHSEEQLRILNHRGGMCIIACAGSGKALKNGTKVLTPKGYKPIEELKLWDEVFDETGNIQRVIGVYPQGKKKVYRVTFNNLLVDETAKEVVNMDEVENIYIDCCKDHLWSYYKGKKGKFITKTTEQLIADGDYNQFVIPTNKGIAKFNESVYSGSELNNADGYLLGMFYNAQKSGEREYSINISHVGVDVMYGIELWMRLHDIDFDIEYTCGECYLTLKNIERMVMGKAQVTLGGGYSELTEKIKYAPSMLREHFINGLCDTSKNVRYNISMLKDINEISETVGCAVKLTRKGKYYGGATRLVRETHARRIESIEETEEYAEMTCISVTGKNSLYLTEHCIATHNTTVLTHLLAKRALTGEIPDLNKLLCTTYSKAGSTEMEERLGVLFKKLGITSKVQVKTMHATYYKILRHFGIASQVCSNSQRTLFINQAVKEAGLKLEDEDLQTLDSLLAFQVNNLLDDQSLCKSYVYTLEDIPVQKYSEIRMLYSKKKQEAGVIDFDDMQMYMYMLLCHQKHPDVIRFCRDQWEYFFIDEFQDISKIQFEILRVMVTDPNKLIVIGDDDQCLVEGTMVHTPDGLKPIESIKEGDLVGTALGRGYFGYRMVNRVSKKEVQDTLYKIKTKSGKVIEATGNHIGFARGHKRVHNRERCVNIDLTMLGSIERSNDSINMGVKPSYKSIVNMGVYGRDQFYRVLEAMPNKVDAKFSAEKRRNETKFNIELESSNVDVLENILRSAASSISIDSRMDININREAQIMRGVTHKFTRFDELQIGMTIPVYEESIDEIMEDIIVDIETSEYKGYVYDLSVPYTRNFVANDVIVHNCIYQWRGADPSIILNICGYYDIQKFVLSTNYRCGGEIVRHAATGIRNNASRSEKEMIPFNGGGSIKIYNSGSSNMYHMSSCAYNYIMKLINERQADLSDIAVLSRNNQHLAILNNMLLKNGYFSECTKEMQFTQLPMYKDIRMIISIMGDTYDHNLVKKALWKVCPYLGVKGSTIIAELMNTTGCSVSKAIGYCLANFASMGRQIGWKESLKMPERVEDKLRYRFHSIGRDSLVGLVEIYKVIKNGTDPEQQLDELLSMYISSVEFMYKSMDKARTLIGLVNYIKSLIKDMGFDKAMTHLNITERYESGKEGVLGPKITMSTMHGAKGKEWKYVILFANDNVSCPSFEGIAKMLEDGVEQRDISGSIDENRRLSYVGMTRAKEELMVFTDKKNMSVYMLEALGILTTGEFKNNTHIIKQVKDGGLSNQLIKAAEWVFERDSKYFIELEPPKAEDIFVEDKPDDEDFYDEDDIWG